MRRTVLLLAALLPAALPAHRAAAQAAPVDSAFLRPGDLIRISVFRQPELSGEFVVSPEGTVQHPLLNQVSVVDVPRPVIRERLRQALSRFEREPSFVFDYLYRVAVGGEVRQPSLYNLSPETTLGQAIAAAGGVTENGRLDRVHLVRGGQDLVVDLQRPDGNGAQLRIRSGDQLRVGRRTNAMRDVIAPAAAVISALASLVTLALTR